MAAACLLAISPFFRWGSPSGHDFEFHVFSWMEVLGQWKLGIIYPRWASLAHWGYGEARFLFYPPASWTFGAALGAILPWKMVPGAYCWIVLTLAATAMYRLARTWLSVADATFAAVFYAVNPYHLLIVYWRSAYAELLAAVLLPFVLLYTLQIYKGDLASPRDQYRPMLWLSVVLAAAWLTNAPAALMIQYSTAGLALLLTARELVRTRAWSRQVWLPLVQTGLAITLGSGLAAFYLLPANYEQGWINLAEVLSPGVRPQDNFLFTLFDDPDHNRFNLLISSVAVVEIIVLILAIWFSRRKKDLHLAAPSARPDESHAEGRWLLISVWGAASGFLMVSASNPLWQYLPKFRFVQLPFRWLLCMNAALALLLVMAAKRWSTRLLVSGVLLATLLIAGYCFQPPWWESSADIREMSDAIADGTGYEGTDEYVPAGADPYELNQKLPRVADDGGAPVQSEIIEWRPNQKHFIVHAPQPQRLELRVFNYPAWRVLVNGQPVQAQSSSVTEQMIIPVPEGTSDVRIQFARTTDRVIGDGISIVSLMVLAAAWISTKRRTLDGVRHA
jgi:hypothetical protein